MTTERVCDPDHGSRRNAVGAALILLNLLEGDAYCTTQISLSKASFLTARTDGVPDL